MTVKMMTGRFLTLEPVVIDDDDGDDDDDDGDVEAEANVAAKTAKVYCSSRLLRLGSVSKTVSCITTEVWNFFYSSLQSFRSNEATSTESRKCRRQSAQLTQHALKSCW